MAQRSLVRLPDVARSAGELARGRLARLYSTVMDGVVQPYDPPLTRTTYLSLPGTAGNYASMPNAADLDLTAGFSVDLFCAATDWTPANEPGWISRGDATKGPWSIDLNAAGKVRVNYFESDGTQQGNVLSTVAMTVTDGADLWVRIDLNPNNGAGNYTINFYTGSNGVDWTALGAQVSAAYSTGIIKTETTPLEIGRDVRQRGTSALFNGKFYRVRLYNLARTTAIRDIIFTNGPVGASTLNDAITAGVVTINGASAAIVKAT